MLMVTFVLAANLLSQRFLSEVHTYVTHVFSDNHFVGSNLCTPHLTQSVLYQLYLYWLYPIMSWRKTVGTCTYYTAEHTHVHIACTYVRMLSGSQSQYIGTVHTVSGYFERFILQQFPLVTYLATMKGCLPHSSVCSTYKGPSFYIYVHVWHESAILLVKTKYPCIFVPFERMHFYCGNCASHANSSGLLSLCLSIPDSPHPVSVCGVGWLIRQRKLTITLQCLQSCCDSGHTWNSPFTSGFEYSCAFVWDLPPSLHLVLERPCTNVQ